MYACTYAGLHAYAYALTKKMKTAPEDHTMVNKMVVALCWALLFESSGLQ